MTGRWDRAEVERLYREASDAGNPPVQHIVREMGMSYSSATSLIGEIRKSGGLADVDGRAWQRTINCPTCGAYPSRQRGATGGPTS